MSLLKAILQCLKLNYNYHNYILFINYLFTKAQNERNIIKIYKFNGELIFVIFIFYNINIQLFYN
jgi:hypothetical protein